jgi:two-component system response regulator GlrR
MKGHVSQAAELAGKDRAEFYRLLRKYALDPKAFKEGYAREGTIPARVDQPAQFSREV